MIIQRLTCGRRKFKLKSGGNVENSKIVEGNNKKIDFENIKFRKIVKKTTQKRFLPVYCI